MHATVQFVRAPHVKVAPRHAPAASKPVPSNASLIYVVQDDFPRIALCNIDTTVAAPTYASLFVEITFTIDAATEPAEGNMTRAIAEAVGSWLSLTFPT